MVRTLGRRITELVLVLVVVMVLLVVAARLAEQDLLCFFTQSEWKIFSHLRQGRGLDRPSNRLEALKH